MQKIASKNIKEVHLLGGEPLLHPELLKIFKIMRNCFNDADIKLISNGILVLQQKESFWKSMKKYNIELAITKYPLNINYQEINHLTKKYGIKYTFYAPSKENSQWHFPLDIKGNQDANYSYQNCRLGNNCTNINIYKGKLYMCPITLNVKYFNKFFKKNCNLEEQDYLRLSDIRNADEIDEFLSKPTPFCKYCDIKNRTFDNKWEVSKKEIQEWI
jgi:hypothetical protein